MDQIGLTHISLSVSDLPGVLARVAEFGGAVVEETVTDVMAMIRDPDGQLIELLSDGWLAALPLRPYGRRLIRSAAAAQAVRRFG